MINKLLQENKRAWDSKLKFSLWADMINTKRALGTSPFHLVYGLDVVFPTSLGLPVMKYLREQEAKPNPIQKIINRLIEFHQAREGICDKSELMQSRMKKIFDRNVKVDDFQIGDSMLK